MIVIVDFEIFHIIIIAFVVIAAGILIPISVFSFLTGGSFVMQDIHDNSYCQEICINNI
jgi:hypothetical protein